MKPEPLSSSNAANNSIPIEQFAAFLDLQHLPLSQGHTDLASYWNSLAWEEKDQSGYTLEELEKSLSAFLAFDPSKLDAERIDSIQILRGQDKSGNPERFDLTFRAGEIICIVGPTGAGKSRLLADIECLAQGDTPTKRTVLLNGQRPDPTKRFSGESGLIAQITQNMNFVMDLTVEDFLHLHAESRSLAEPDAIVRRVLEVAVDMAGEPFDAETQVTQLSGGQSRALMIADAAYLSPKPIVLIDEIENAGVDRTRALKLFSEKGKIVLLATHDPLLALSGHRRLVIANGAVKEVIEPCQAEIQALEQLSRLDVTLSELREKLRSGQRIERLQVSIET